MWGLFILTKNEILTNYMFYPEIITLWNFFLFIYFHNSTNFTLILNITSAGNLFQNILCDDSNCSSFKAPWSLLLQPLYELFEKLKLSSKPLICIELFLYFPFVWGCLTLASIGLIPGYSMRLRVKHYSMNHLYWSCELWIHFHDNFLKRHMSQYSLTSSSITLMVFSMLHEHILHLQFIFGDSSRMAQTCKPNLGFSCQSMRAADMLCSCYICTIFVSVSFFGSHRQGSCWVDIYGFC